MTLKGFKRKIVNGLPAGIALRHVRHVDRAFDICLEQFDAKDIEGCCEQAETLYQGRTNKAVPWMLLVTIFIELLKWWLENRTTEKRTLMRGWQREMRALNH